MLGEILSLPSTLTSNVSLSVTSAALGSTREKTRFWAQAAFAGIVRVRRIKLQRAAARRRVGCANIHCSVRRGAGLEPGQLLQSWRHVEAIPGSAKSS